VCGTKGLGRTRFSLRRFLPYDRSAIFNIMISTQQLKTFFTANQKVLRFLSLFAAIFGVCYFIFGLTQGVRMGIIKPYTVLLAKAVALIINLFGAAAIATDAVVQSPKFTLSIAMGCDGVEATCLFLAGVLAFPTSWRARFVGLAMGIPLIQLINVGRLVGLYYAGIFLPSVIEEVHIYVAQALVIFLSTAILIYWLERVAHQHKPA
jgi:exosortase H (IPTLxxWG-CTERM-specific)